MENKIKSLSMKKNLIFSWIIQILTYAIPLVTAPYVARVLTPEGVGQFTFANSIIQYFVLVVSFGMVDYGTHKIAKRRDTIDGLREEFWTIFLTRFILFLFVALVFVILLFSWGFASDLDKTLVAILSIGLLNTALDLTFFYRGMENFKIVSLSNIIAKILFLVFLFIFVKTKEDLLIYSLIYVAATFVGNFIMIVVSIKTIGRPQFSIKRTVNCFRESFFYFLPTIATSIISILDITVLGYLSSKTEVGYYEEANKLINIISAIPLAICPIIISRITKLKEEQQFDKIESKFIQLFDLYALIVFPSFLGIIAVCKYLVPVFFGDEYMRTIDVLYWLSPLLVCVPFSYSLCCAYYIPNEKINYVTLFQFIINILNLIANILILKFTDLGAVGVAITSCPSAILMALVTFLFAWKHVYAKKVLLSMIKPIIASLIMFAVIIVLDLIISKYLGRTALLIIEVGVGIVVYGISVILLKDQIVIGSLRSLKNRLFKKKSEEN